MSSHLTANQVRLASAGSGRFARSLIATRPGRCNPALGKSWIGTGGFSKSYVHTLLDTGDPPKCSLSREGVSDGGKSQIVKMVRLTAVFETVEAK